MNNSLYRQEILEHYEHPHNFGRPNSFTHSHTESNQHCGDDITVYLNIQNGQIESANFTGTGCAISMFAASKLTDLAKGMNLSRLKKMGVSELMALLQLELTPTRLKCAYLPLEAIKRAAAPNSF